jgi:hypothetical protein
MRTCLVAALVLLLLTGAAFSQSNRDRPSEGSYGLTFMLTGLQQFSADVYPVVPIEEDTSGVLNGGIGLKYYFSKKLAGRIGLGFALNSTTTKPLPDASSNAVDETRTLTVFTIAPGLEFTLIDAGDIRGYAGVQLGMLSATLNVDGWDNQSGDSYKNTRWLYFGGAFLGAEWFFANRLSLGAEYQFQYIIRSGKNTTTFGTNTSERDLNTESWLDLKSGSSLNVLVNIYL